MFGWSRACCLRSLCPEIARNRAVLRRVISCTFNPPGLSMRILVTAGPTREYLDDVRYLTNASSGRMGYAVAKAAIDAGWEVVLITGPVELPLPAGCEIHSVVTTQEMRDVSLAEFDRCDGLIAAAAVCDYKPRERISGKMSKTGGPISLEMIETDDVLAELGRRKEDRWVVGFALEAQNPRENALQKLRRKNCDWIVLNAPSAIGAETNAVELLEHSGDTVAAWSGTKSAVAASLIAWLEERVNSRRSPDLQPDDDPADAGSS